MSQDIEGVPTDGINDRKTVDLILYQRVHSVKYTARNTTQLHSNTHSDEHLKNTHTWRQVRYGPEV